MRIRRLFARRRLPAVAATMTALVVVGTGCSAAVQPPPPRPPTVKVTMTDYAFNYRATIPRGRVVFDVTNRGHVDHKLTLVYLPDDVPPIQEQLKGTDRRLVEALAGTVDRAPGSRDVFSAELPPGRWAFVCYSVNADGRSHAELGMATEFRVA